MKLHLSFVVSLLLTVGCGGIIALGAYLRFVTLADFFSNVFSVLVYAFLTALATTILLLVTGRWKKGPEVVLEPLPHVKGWPKPPPPDVAREDWEAVNAEVKKGVVVRRETQLQRYTDPSVSPELRQSQYYVLNAWLQEKNEIKSIVLKFGIIKARCKSGEVFQLKVSIRSRPMVESNTQANQIWLSTGYVNWYSESVRSNLPAAIAIELNRFLPTPAIGFNKFLLNTVLDHLGEKRGEEAELLLFYMIQGLSDVFLCTDLISSPIGRVTNGNPLIFEVELKPSGQDYTGDVWKYRVTALWDDFNIEPI